MSPSSSPLEEPDKSQDPFNQYNTEFVKLDSNNWNEETGECRRPSLSEFVCLKRRGSLKKESSSLSSSSMPDDAGQCQRMAQKQGMDTSGADSINVGPKNRFRIQPQLNHIINLPCNPHLSNEPQNKSFTDVTFIVGPSQHSKKYVGHRVLLAMTSPVFETMFYGDMADKNKYIRIPDVAPIGFENLLRYAYTDSLNLGSVEDAMLTAYAAKKYLLPQLLKECLSYIEHNIGASTACVVFEFAQVLNSQQLVLQAMNLIDRQTLSVINNKSFSHVQASTVEFIANRRYLSLGSEYALFSALLSWALSEANRRGAPKDDWLTVRAILRESPILSGVRFLAMEPEEFARAVLKSSSKVEVSVSSLMEQQQRVAEEPAREENGDSGAICDSAALSRKLVDVEDPNSLLSEAEQRAILLNLALRNSAQLPAGINQSARARQPPPECFSLRRFKSASNLINTTTTTRSIKSISSKFQCLSENVFIVALTIPIRLDVSSYSNRTPKFECHLKFTTKQAGSQFNGSSPIQADPIGANSQPGTNQHGDASLTTGSNNSAPLPLEASTLLMDTIDDSLHISIARDKDCLVRLKRPILIRMGNINELTLTFQTYALDEDVVALKTPKLRSGNFSEQTDGENISWLFFKSSNIEFSELHYYY